MSSQPATVMVVDDDVTNVAILAELLQPEFEVVFATSGRQAFDLISRAKPDLVLLDVVMPDMDGYSVCAQLKSDSLTAGIPVIFITGLLESDSESHGLEIGGADYVTKPFSPQVVRARIRIHLELKRARDVLAALAASDGLTGLANRRAFDETIGRECKRLARSQGSIALMMLDLDAFKAFNDCYGHVAGDDCLRAVARVLTSSMQRSTDIAARYGGEEFVCIFPDTDVRGALAVAKRVKAGIADLAIPHMGQSTGSTLTASFGVIGQTCTAETDPLSLIRSADACLYRAKAAGRDRIVTPDQYVPTV